MKDKIGRRVAQGQVIGGQPTKALVGHSPQCACRACENMRRTAGVTKQQIVEEYIEKPADPRWHLLVWYWCPDKVISERVKKSRVLYDQWMTMGFIQPTPGTSVDYSFIRARINELRRKFNIVEIGFDEWGSKQLIGELEKDGLKVKLVRQGFKTLNAPTKTLVGLITSKKLEHYGDPVLEWMSGNVEADTDAAGNIKPDKALSREKIDGIAAAIDALSVIEETPGMASGGLSSVYERRGITFI
jgi:phage terminase large subunit-like protein